VKNAATVTYYAVSIKHLSLYLAEINYRFNRRFDLTSHDATIWLCRSKTPAISGVLSDWLELSEFHT